MTVPELRWLCLVQHLDDVHTLDVGTGRWEMALAGSREVVSLVAAPADEHMAAARPGLQSQELH